MKVNTKHHIKMNKIITSSQVQKKIGQLSNNIGKETYIVTVYGKGKIVMLPYFDGCMENMKEYMEDYEMLKNKDKLQKFYTESSESGLSSLSI